MHLGFTDEQRELRDTARAVLDRECTPAVVREVVEKGTGADRLWRCLADLGWPALTVPEAAGGLGRGFVELAVVLEELGRVVAPGPYLATTTQFLPAIREAGTPDQAERWMGTVARGEVSGTLALAEGTSWDATSVRATARRVGPDWVLRGTKRHVLSGTQVDEVVVAVRRADDDRLALAVVPAHDLDIEATGSLDASRPLATIRLDGVRVPDDRLLGHAGTPVGGAVARTLQEATAGLAVDTVGACQALLDMTLAYAKVREQFGRPIGSFQALKHRFADMLVALEKARVTAHFAALTIAEDDPRRPLAVSMAKAAAGDCQRLVAASAVQLHGGIGFTWEHDVHLWVKRATTGGLLFGTSSDHRRMVAEHVFSS
ncbi:MAG: acyl-CoA dehydrogenase family protein [Acidimicrobiales bacterium]